MIWAGQRTLMATISDTAEGSPVNTETLRKRSGVETIKQASRQLRGTIALELVADTDHFNDQDKQLLKFHGTYQQDDRDARKNRHKGKLPPGADATRHSESPVAPRLAGSSKEYIFMVRCKIPGGRLTAQQYLAVDDLAGAYGNGT